MVNQTFYIRVPLSSILNKSNHINGSVGKKSSSKNTSYALKDEYTIGGIKIF